jgi:hypothetical protein
VTTALPTPPTDLELMMLADGELDPARQAEIEAFLAADDDGAGRGKLAGLRAVSAIVASTARWPEAPAARPGAADVVADVMRRIDDGDGGAARPRQGGSVAPGAPANDNARLIFGLAFAAAAAAAAVFVWGRAGDPADELEARRSPPAESAAPPLADPRLAAGASAKRPGDPAAPGAGAEARYGVEVASVDFGQRSGAIYYVPAGADATAEGAAAAAVTTVVWLADE